MNEDGREPGEVERAGATSTVMPVATRAMPPVLGRLLRGTFWLALRTPLLVIFAFWRVPLILEAIGENLYGAFGFAWGFGFFQMLFELGMSSAIHRQVSDRWTRGDFEGVRRSLACGMIFYSLAAVVQAGALIAIATFAVPDRFGPAGQLLIVQLLWLQAVTAPCYGISTISTSVLQAMRRYDFIPRLEVLIVTAQFAVLWAGLRMGVDFFLLCVIQMALSLGLSLVPSYWVMIRELGGMPTFRGASWVDFRDLMSFSAYMALIQLSVVLADKIDTTVLGWVLESPGPAIAVYQAISKPFLQIRNMGWMLAYLVMPAVVSLAASDDHVGMDKVKYDGTRMHVGMLLPVVLLALFDARPFLAAWVPDFAEHAGLMQLFLVGTVPLVLAVMVQMAMAIGRVRVIALAALAGAVVNLPLSITLTYTLGNLSGVIWGTVVTTLFSNLLVPGIYCFRVLDVKLGEFVRRTLQAPLAGAALLLPAVWLTRGLVAPEAMAGASRLVRVVPLLEHLTIGLAAYAVGYLLVPTGRADIQMLTRKLRQRLGWLPTN